MNCPKCKKEIPYNSNLCCYCGNPIRKKCPECGKMELIGRKACETRVNEANEQKAMHTEKELGFLFSPSPKEPLILLLPLIVVIIVIVIYGYITINIFRWDPGEFYSLVIPLFLAAIFGFGLGMPIYKLGKKKRKKAEDTFRQKFPYYAEIIKKAESADA